MNAVLEAGAGRRIGRHVGHINPFDLSSAASCAAYADWRTWKLDRAPRSASDLLVDVADPHALSPAERSALLAHIAAHNVAIYRSPARVEDKALPAALGRQLGLHRLDANWLADEDGISSIEVSERSDERGGFIPYTAHPIRWHTDGYYHPPSRTIHGMILHCVRPARHGGETRLLDPELAYIALRDHDVAHIHALMQPDAMTIPAREDGSGVARAAQTGPVFSLHGGALHMRYTARTRSIGWKADAATLAAVAALEALLNGDSPWIIATRLEAGMGVVGHNSLHERSGFDDDPAAPRLLYRARFLDRCTHLDPRERTDAATREHTGAAPREHTDAATRADRTTGPAAARPGGALSLPEEASWRTG